MLDINATYISIMHGIKQQPLPGREDIYAIGDLPREVVKMWVAISFSIEENVRKLTSRTHYAGV